MSNVWNTDGPTTPRGDHGAQSHVDPRGGAAPAYGESALNATTQRNRSAVTLLIVAGISSVVGCFLTIPAAILGILAVVKQDQPARSAKFTRWGWIAYAVGATVTVLAGAVLVGVAFYAASGNN